MVRTRIAPSPTGYAHIGTIYQALFNYAYARKNGGKFIIRIEDTDRARFVKEAEDFIFDSIDWVGLTEDESPRKPGEVGPYRQSERLSLYHTYAQELVDNGHAFFSYFPKKDAGQKKDYSQGREEKTFTSEEDPPKTIEEMIQKGDWVVRMKVQQDHTIIVKDEIRGEITFPTKEITEQVLIKSDGFPTYHLGVVVDDHLMEISHILRAEEWLSSLPKHVLLYQYFGWKMPPIYHTATLRNPDKSKLSKRHGHTNVLWYKDEGFLPEAVLNYLAHLGWTHPEEKEIFSLEEFIEKFDLTDIRPVAAVFDLTKLTWMNQQYIQNLADGELKKRLENFYKDDQGVKDIFENKTIIDLIIKLAKTRMKTLKEFKDLLMMPSVARNDEEREVAKDLLRNLEKNSDWTKEHILETFKLVMQKHGIRMPILYYILTGRERGLPLPELIEGIGKDKTIAILHAYNES